MGFGTLFIGYLLAFLLSLINFGFVIRLVGYALMAISFFKLREFGREFRYPLIVSLFMTIYGIYDAVYQSIVKMSIALPVFIDTLSGVMTYVNLIGIIALNISTLYAIYMISSRLELYKQKKSAIRNSVILVIYFVLNVLGVGPLHSNQIYVKYFGLPTFLMQLGWTLLNIFLIFSCYMYICPEGDEDMPRKKSKIGFIDKMQAESDKRMEQAVKDTEKYIKEKQQNRIDRLQKKNEKKHKKK